MAQEMELIKCRWILVAIAIKPMAILFPCCLQTFIANATVGKSYYPSLITWTPDPHNIW